MSQKQDDRAKLMAKRDELMARLESIKADYNRGLSADSGERAIELENAEVLEGILQSTVEEIDRIEQLLANKNK